jgi:3-oxoacyl-[acyl-carrier-protein] synthase-1
VPGQPIIVVDTGLVTSVGLSASAACAAIRAAITNHTETAFMLGGAWIMGAQVPLATKVRGLGKLAQMLAMSIEECLSGGGLPQPGTLPLLLCVAERGRPGRLQGLDDELLGEVSRLTGVEFHPEFSGVIARGRVGVAVALAEARRLLYQRACPQVLVAAADSLLVAETVGALHAEDRLLSPRNSDGFVPGEAAGALLLSSGPTSGPHLACLGIGFGREPSASDPDVPLRADGLTQAIQQGLADAGCALHDLDFRITDNSGEQYYFKEATLALSRTLRQRKETFDIWHPADCIGEVGAAIGAAMISVALMAGRKRYGPGSGVLWHVSSDTGERAAAVLRYEDAA